MTELKFKIGKEELKAVLEEEKAPLTCEFFKKMLPIKNKIIHVRWSGEAVWIPYGDTKQDFLLKMQRHIRKSEKWFCIPAV